MAGGPGPQPRRGYPVSRRLFVVTYEQFFAFEEGHTDISAALVEGLA